VKLSELRAELNDLDRMAKYGCGNHGCIICAPAGLGTNSICMCSPYKFSERLLWLAAECESGGRYNKFEKETKTAETRKEGAP
jgi:hypothetical protein